MIYISKQTKRLILSTLLITLISIGGFFYFYQNSGNLPGGNIALSKILWLSSIVFFWFIAPILLLLNGVKNKTDQLLLYIHLSNVWLRGLIELFMMYQYENWHPNYGIIHDIFSLFLLLILTVYFRNSLTNFVKYFLIIIMMTFIVETFFAQYMLNNVIDTNNPVFFVPETTEHQNILLSTWMVLFLLSIYLIFFVKQWCKVEDD